MEAKGLIFLLTFFCQFRAKLAKTFRIKELQKKVILNHMAQKQKWMFWRYTYFHNIRINNVACVWRHVFYSSLPGYRYPQVIKKAPMQTNKWYIICEVRTKFGSSVLLHYVGYPRIVMWFWWHSPFFQCKF